MQVPNDQAVQLSLLALQIPVSPAGVALADRDGDSRRSCAVRARKAAGDPTSTA
jgi:hypothetical protein